MTPSNFLMLTYLGMTSSNDFICSLVVRKSDACSSSSSSILLYVDILRSIDKTNTIDVNYNFKSVVC